MEKHILVIDKEKFIRSMFESGLKGSNLKVYTIDTLENNYYLIDELKPVAIFFDIHSSMGEWKKLSTFKAQSKLYPMGFHEDFDLIKGMESEFTGLIEKPIATKNFKEVIERYCL